MTVIYRIGDRVKLVGPLHYVDYAQGLQPGQILTVSELDKEGFYPKESWSYFMFEDYDVIPSSDE